MADPGCQREFGPMLAEDRRLAHKTQEQAGNHEDEYRQSQREMEQRRVVDDMPARFRGKPGSHNQHGRCPMDDNHALRVATDIFVPRNHLVPCLNWPPGACRSSFQLRSATWQLLMN